MAGPARKGDVTPDAQLRFRFRASLLFIALLAFWWFVLRVPFLDWVQFSSEFILQHLPGIHSPTGVNIEAGRVWNLHVPVPGGHSIHLRADERLPTLYTVALPLFWAVLLAGPWSRHLLRSFAIGTAILLPIPAISLLIYAAHAGKLNLYRSTAPALGYTLTFADYLARASCPTSSRLFSRSPSIRISALSSSPARHSRPTLRPRLPHARPSPVRIGYRRNVTPEIPADALAHIAPILEALNRSFRPLAATLTAAEEPAVIFDSTQEPAE